MMMLYLPFSIFVDINEWVSAFDLLTGSSHGETMEHHVPRAAGEEQEEATKEKDEDVSDTEAPL